MDESKKEDGAALMSTRHPLPEGISEDAIEDAEIEIKTNRPTFDSLMGELDEAWHMARRDGNPGLMLQITEAKAHLAGMF